MAMDVHSYICLCTTNTPAVVVVALVVVVVALEIVVAVVVLGVDADATRQTCGSCGHHWLHDIKGPNACLYVQPLKRYNRTCC